MEAFPTHTAFCASGIEGGLVKFTVPFNCVVEVGFPIVVVPPAFGAVLMFVVGLLMVVVAPLNVAGPVRFVVPATFVVEVPFPMFVVPPVAGDALMFVVDGEPAAVLFKFNGPPSTFSGAEELPMVADHVGVVPTTVSTVPADPGAYAV